MKPAPFWMPNSIIFFKYFSWNRKWKKCYQNIQQVIRQSLNKRAKRTEKHCSVIGILTRYPQIRFNLCALINSSLEMVPEPSASMCENSLRISWILNGIFAFKSFWAWHWKARNSFQLISKSRLSSRKNEFAVHI